MHLINRFSLISRKNDWFNLFWYILFVVVLMSFSSTGIRITLLLILFGGIFFFVNTKPKYVVPFTYLKHKLWLIYTILLGLLLVAVVLLPLRLSFVSDKQVVVDKDLPIQIILDVSLSMAANDIQPSRFAAAKTALTTLVQQLDGYYISLITFSWKPFVYIPFSSSASAITTKLHTMNLGDFPPVQDFLGTAIGDALLLGVSNLQYFAHQETYKPWIVILITDGDSNVGFDPLQVISYYQKTDIPVYVLWVGQQNYLIGRDSWDTEITTDINLPLLQHVASKTWGSFYRVLWDQSFEDFFAQLSQRIVDQQHRQVQNILREFNDYLIYFIVVLLFGVIIFRSCMLFSFAKKTW